VSSWPSSWRFEPDSRAADAKRRGTRPPIRLPQRRRRDRGGFLNHLRIGPCSAATSRKPCPLRAGLEMGGGRPAVPNSGYCRDHEAAPFRAAPGRGRGPAAFSSAFAHRDAATADRDHRGVQAAPAVSNREDRASRQEAGASVGQNSHRPGPVLALGTARPHRVLL